MMSTSYFQMFEQKIVCPCVCVFPPAFSLLNHVFQKYYLYYLSCQIYEHTIQ